MVKGTSEVKTLQWTSYLVQNKGKIEVGCKKKDSKILQDAVEERPKDSIYESVLECCHQGSSE